MRTRILALLSAAATAIALVAVPATAQAAPAPLNWVHMGDSYASGTGAASYQAGTDVNGCWRSDNSYAQQLKAQMQAQGRQFTFKNVACSGATTASMYTTFKGEPAQLNALNSSTTLVTINIGGNDADFGTYSGQCLNADCFGQPTSDVLDKLPQVGENVAKLLKEIQRRSPKASIVLVGYGRIVTPGGNAPNVPLDPVCDPQYLSSQERLAANGVSSSLDFTLRGTAVASKVFGVKVKYVSPYATSFSATPPFLGTVVPSFRGRSLCEQGVGSQEPGVVGQAYHGLTAFTDQAAGDAVFHWNPTGHTLMVPLVKQAASL